MVTPAPKSPRPPRSATASGALAAFLFAVLLGSCGEPPVIEEIELAFGSSPAVEARIVTRLGKESDYQGNDEALSRLHSAREALRCGTDAWTEALQRLRPSALVRTSTSLEGEARQVVRQATYADGASLERLFDGYPLFVSVTRGEEWETLEIHPGRPVAASVAERHRVEEALAGFSGAASRYYLALAALWDWLDSHPEWERLVLVSLAGGKVEGEPEELKKRPGFAELEKLYDAADEAMRDVKSAGNLEKKKGESLDELSRRVFDPFPARLTVRLPGPPLEAEGFVVAADRVFRVPSVGLLGAVAGLGSRWITPDPLAALLEAGREEGRKVDFDSFLSIPRSVRGRPSSSEVRAALDKALAPAPLYRLRWPLPLP